MSWIPAAIVMVVIFMFSAKPAVNSDESSKAIATQVLKLYENITNNEYDNNTRNNIIDKINHIVRKSAHFLEYALLALCFSLHLKALKVNGKYLLLLYATLFSAFYALSDEIHQYFIPGRSCQLRDVLLDSCGAATGALFFLLLIHSYRYIKKTRN
jgi:VanZ family protein